MEGHSMSVLGWLLGQGDLNVAAWCLGGQALWARAPWSAEVPVHQLFTQTVNFCMDILDIVIPDTRYLHTTE
jgi:hypothetical protein